MVLCGPAEIQSLKALTKFVVIARPRRAVERTEGSQRREVDGPWRMWRPSEALRGFTQMNDLQARLRPCGLVVLCFPCNQSGHQENAKNEEILHFLKYVRPGGGFKPNVTLFGKCEVNRIKAHPLFCRIAASPAGSSCARGVQDRAARGPAPWPPRPEVSGSARTVGFRSTSRVALLPLVCVVLPCFLAG
ncbi:PREDICTED: glutathione peroxidase 3-like [Chinchilla lanigera]|uniref:glutathione peroxidase 3-like n=1 Tax=Chinchilla lanigera TaxID=34839 RepID=UPI000698614D|nr:PREDICTED: glutathione peroxidase 3-like [Chinchilla lanigera]